MTIAFRCRSLACAALLAAPLSAVAQRVAPAAITPAALAGEWAFFMDGDPQPQRVTLALAGDTLRGRVYGQAFAATLAGARLAFAVGEFRWRGTVRGDTIAGWLGIAPDSSRWTAVRQRAVAGRRHEFTPTRWTRLVSAREAPALRLVPGDTVHTWTVDAGGWGTGALGDRANKRTAGGNPLVGPFVVEGALPGDVLVVRLLRVRLNRGWATSGTALVDNAIEPAYAAERKFDNLDRRWVLDTAAGVARLAAPPPALRDFTVPLHPFLGVVAVAPPDSVVASSRDAGAWGGNMEVRHLREGTTVYLPVSATGAHLFIGDGHAAQGDGELTGDALETTMDVTFTVEVRRWGFQRLVRAETDSAILSLGVAGSLDEAARSATSDMARWLASEWKLTASEAAIVMGFALSYDIPDLVPPQAGVVARVRRSALAALRPASGPRSP